MSLQNPGAPILALASGDDLKSCVSGDALSRELKNHGQALHVHFWWTLVYQRKGFIIDKQPFLCSGQMEAAWKAIKVISTMNQKYSASHGA